MLKFKDVITPHPTHPPQPHVLRSIQHVCNFNDVFTPHPTHPPNPTHVTGVKENALISPFTVGEARSKTRRYVRLEPTNNKQTAICLSTSTRHIYTSTRFTDTIPLKEDGVHSCEFVKRQTVDCHQKSGVSHTS